MRERLWRDSSRFTLSAQLIALVLVLSLAAMVLIRTWAGVISTARSTEALNKGVLLCRNAAEVYTREADISAAAEALGGEGAEEGESLSLAFDRELKSTAPEQAFLTLELEEGETEEPGLHSCEMTVRQDGEEVYRLRVTAFAPEKGA